MTDRRTSIHLVETGSLSREDWEELGPLIDAALDTSPERRAEILNELSRGDKTRRARLERLVADCEREYTLLERPAAERFTELFGTEDGTIPQALADRYQIVRELGRGGMAVVYIARDLRHGRDVAIKFVRPELAAALGRARFLREIEIAARLRHPHLVPLYDSGESEGVLYYVMPYEGGHSLRQRLARDGPLPIDDVVVILRDLCEALAYAHENGVVHRDIKPDNVLLSGRHAMITDFGVARAITEAAVDAAGIQEGSTASTTTLVTAGAVGTPAYMAPEQMAGDPNVDHRADIYAVGVLAYELLTNTLPSARVSVKHYRPEVPDALASVIMKCLAKSAADRWQSANEALAALDSIDSQTSRRTWMRRSLIAVTVSVMLLGGLFAFLARRKESLPPISVGRATQLTAESGLEVQPSISPDGKLVAYAAGHSLNMQIFVRPTDGGRPARLTNDTTENEWLPQWAPDGSRVLFLTRGGVFSAPASGGRARMEIESRPGVITWAAWSPDGKEIAYVRRDSLLAHNVASGRVRLISTARELHSCSWHPNGQRLACVSGNSYYVTVGAIFGLGPMFGNVAPSRIVLVAASGGAPTTVTDSVSLHQSPVWSRDGKTLYFVSNEQGPRDIYALDATARDFARAKRTRITTGLEAHSVGISSTGTQMVYAVYRSRANVWAVKIPENRSASVDSAVAVTAGNQTVEGVRVSPDGRYVVYDSDLSGNSDIYRVSVNGGEPERLTNAPIDEFRGSISPDGKELTYHTFQTGSRNVFTIPVSGGRAKQLTFSSSQLSMANWSPDGTALTLFDLETGDVFVMRRDKLGRWSSPDVVARNGLRPEWSPDGKSIVFVSLDDGRIRVVSLASGKERDVYVPSKEDPLPELALYAANGRDVYFKSHDARGRASFWSVPADGGRPQLLLRFDDPSRASNRFEFATDGKRFYFAMEDRQSDVWLAEVASR